MQHIDFTLFVTLKVLKLRSHSKYDPINHGQSNETRVHFHNYASCIKRTFVTNYLLLMSIFRAQALQIGRKRNNLAHMRIELINSLPNRMCNCSCFFFVVR